VNRRAFLTRTLGAIAAAVVAPLVPTVAAPVVPVYTPITFPLGFTALTYRGKPFVWDEMCSKNHLYTIPDQSYFVVYPSASSKGSD
jgi:hypothetical protein